MFIVRVSHLGSHDKCATQFLLGMAVKSEAEEKRILMVVACAVVVVEVLRKSMST